MRSTFTTQRVTKYRFYFENSHRRLKLWVKSQVGARNYDNSAGMMRLKEQKSIFIGLWITFWWLSKPVGKSRSRKYPQGFEKPSSTTSWSLLNFKKQHTHAHSVFVQAFPDRSPRVRHPSELTEKDWENAVQGLGKTTTMTMVTMMTMKTMLTMTMMIKEGWW